MNLCGTPLSKIRGSTSPPGPKVMRDVRMLRNFLDGKIPKVCADDSEQLRILLAKCKKILGKWPILLICSMKQELMRVEYCKDMSPVKSSYSAGKESASKQETFKLLPKDDTKDDSTLSSESDDCRRRKRKRKKKKIKRKRRHHSSSSSTSESEDKVRAARVSRHSFTMPHYYHGYPIPFNAGHRGNIQNVALNTSQVHGMHLEIHNLRILRICFIRKPHFLSHFNFLFKVFKQLSQIFWRILF